MVNPSLAFLAKSFFEAYQILKQRNAELMIPRYFAPIIVNGAFATELALKSILTENHMNYKKEHNLWALFMLLPTDLAIDVVNRSMSITAAYQELGKWVDEMILISEAFVDWRYCFENRTPAFDVAFFDSFVCAVYETFISHYNVEMTEDNSRVKTDSELEEMFADNRLHSREAILEKLARKRK